MDIEQWKWCARWRLENGTMTEDEWREVLDALLVASESTGLPDFDAAIEREAWRVKSS